MKAEDWFLSVPNGDLSVQISEPGRWVATASWGGLSVQAVSACPFEARELAVKQAFLEQNGAAE